MELRRLRAVVLSRSDHAGRRRLADRDTARFGGPVGNRAEGAHPRRIEGCRVIGKIVSEYAMGRRNRRRLGGDAGRRIHRAQIGFVITCHGVHGFEHGEVGDRRNAVHLRWRLVGHDRHHDLVPVEDDVGARDGRAEHHGGT